MGNVIQAGQGQAPARQATILAGKNRDYVNVMLMWSSNSNPSFGFISLYRFIILFIDLCNVVSQCNETLCVNALNIRNSNSNSDLNQ